ncbi:MAG: hypothetical protein K9M17_05295 [Mariprofundaceae bacterium]|nr:hypothetical protein [Mariprofundaceae bacterium]
MKLIKRPLFTLSMALLLLLSSCATLQQGMELSPVKFTFDRVSSVRVAGIDLMNIHEINELNMFQIARATLAVSRESLPLDLTVHLKTENPMINQIAATLVSMDWTLMLDGRETISGTLNERITLPAGEAQSIPLKLSLNMFEYFNEKNALDMLDLALAFAGSGGSVPEGVALRIRPTISTPFGPMTYKEMLIEPHAH